MSSRPRFRFAPSPNGRLHLGHAFSALTVQQLARDAGGETLLRIEDIDIARSRPEFIDGIIEDLKWIGFDWQGPVRRQSEHLDDYRETIRRLDSLGVLYPCIATRKDIARAISMQPGDTPWPRDPDGSPRYTGQFRDRPDNDPDRIRESGQPYALRIDMARAYNLAVTLNGGPPTFVELGSGPDGSSGRLETDPRIWGDVVIARKDVPTSYHVSVVCDDALQGITHVTRGHDLFHATAIHRLLQILLDLSEPLYHHHQLIHDTTGRKLSKSARDTSLKALRESGVGAAALRSHLGFRQA